LLQNSSGFSFTNFLFLLQNYFLLQNSCFVAKLLRALFHDLFCFVAKLFFVAKLVFFLLRNSCGFSFTNLFLFPNSLPPHFGAKPCVGVHSKFIYHHAPARLRDWIWTPASVINFCYLHVSKMPQIQARISGDTKKTVLEPRRALSAAHPGGSPESQDATRRSQDGSKTPLRRHETPVRYPRKLPRGAQHAYKMPLDPSKMPSRCPKIDLCLTS